VAFGSGAFNLAPNDSNGVSDILVKDRDTGKVENLTNISTNLAVVNTGACAQPRLSADGRTVAFLSSGQYESFGSGWSQNTPIFRPVIYDRETGKFTHVRGSTTDFFNDHAYGLSLSADGRYLAFSTTATNTGFTTTGTTQVYLCDFGPNRDFPFPTLTLVSHATSSTSTPANAGCNVWDQGISADGEFVVFESSATNLAAADTDSGSDVYLWRRSTGTVTLMSQPSAGGFGGLEPGISADGSTIGYVRHDQSLFPQPSYLSCELVTVGTGQRRIISDPALKVDAGSQVRLSGDASRVVYATEQGLLIQQVLYVEGRGRQLLTRSTTGELPTVSVYAAAISTDGRWGIWSTEAPNMVSDDTNGYTDIFIRGPL